MGLIDQIRERLAAKQAEWQYTVANGTITVAAPVPGGFSVWLSEPSLTVGFDGWHEHFASEEEALNCFAFGCVGPCRLKVTLRGTFPYTWTLETRSADGNEWVEDSTTGLLLFPFWRAKRIEYRQNVTGD